MAIDCDAGHPSAKTSEQAFRVAMTDLAEAEDLGGRGGLWGTCPRCKSTLIYRRETPPQDPAMNLSEIAIVASNPRKGSDLHVWDVDVEIRVAGQDPIKGEIAVKHRPDRTGVVRDASVVWTSAEIHHFMVGLGTITMVALLRRLDDVAVTRIRAL